MTDPVIAEEILPPGKSVGDGVDVSAWLWRLALIIGLLLVWEFTAGNLFNEFWSSRPSLIGERLLLLLKGGELWRHVHTTVTEALLGLFLGALIGTPIQLKNSSKSVASLTTVEGSIPMNGAITTCHGGPWRKSKAINSPAPLEPNPNKPGILSAIS